jgi:hypothetical protein
MAGHSGQGGRDNRQARQVHLRQSEVGGKPRESIRHFPPAFSGRVTVGGGIIDNGTAQLTLGFTEIYTKE